MAIRNRKNASFYKTTHGAEVGDLFMSLIHTCELAGANPFEYLSALQQYASLLQTNPCAWMPWNYRDAIPTRASVASE
jgi:transposase